MSTKIRLTRKGAKKKPFYRIVVADARAPRDGDFIEIIGTYNPMLNKDNVDRVVIKKERFEHWFSVGAIPSDTVSRLVKKFDIKNPYAEKIAKRKRSTERKPKPAKKQSEG